MTAKPKIASEPTVDELQTEVANLREVIRQQNAMIERVTARFGAAQLNFEQAQAQLQQRASA